MLTFNPQKLSAVFADVMRVNIR